MKSVNFIATISLFLAASHVFACGPIIYAPSEYYLFHLVDLPEGADGSFNLNSHENCLLWQQQSASDIPLDDIYQVVYKYKLETLKALESHRYPSEAKGNRMAHWLASDGGREALCFLILAKNCEWLRSEFLSPWYYPSKKDPVKYSLNDVALLARNKSVTSRFGDRYALQAVRAMTSLQQYQEIVRYWNQVKGLLHEGFLRQMTLSYVAGACVHLGDIEQAKAYYKEANDLKGLLECDRRFNPGLSRVEEMELLYESYPDCPEFRRKLWEILGRIEPSRDWDDLDTWQWADNRDEIIALGRLCDRVLDSDLPADKALWAYAATYIAHLQGDDHQADRYLKVAEKQTKDPNLADAIRVMRIYIDAQINTYDHAYEQRLFGHLQWLQQKIEDGLDDEVAKGFHLYQLTYCFSHYYWNDAMRCILLGTVCPKLVAQGNTTLALQLANMASYSLLNKMNRVDVAFYLSDDIAKYGTHLTMNLYRYRHSGFFNEYDYCNHFASMADTMTADDLIAYTAVALRPHTSFQRFLNAHSYVDPDYLNEMIGTHCLREMRYADAERYLLKVAPDYFLRTNVFKDGYLNRDPFRVEHARWNHGGDAKLFFARRMNRLEQDIAATADPNQKAMLMIDFGIGLRNAFDYCWALTQYVQGWVSGGYLSDWEYSEQTRQAQTCADQLINQAFNAFTDDEYQAQAQLLFCNYKTVAERYPETLAARQVVGHCDRYRDYHAERRQ